MKRLGSGIYLARTNKPYAIFGLPLIGRHNGYVGQSNAYELRWAQHTHGGGKFKSVAKGWSDLDPEFHRIIPLPKWMFERTPKVVDALEWLAIKLLLPVYNDKMNHSNPRRIPKERLWKQRRFRTETSGGIRISIMLLRSSFKLLLLLGAFLLLRKGGLL